MRSLRTDLSAVDSSDLALDRRLKRFPPFRSVFTFDQGPLRAQGSQMTVLSGALAQQTG